VDVLNERLQNASDTALRQMRAERALELQAESILGIMTKCQNNLQNFQHKSTSPP
jgi:uncharacterized protein YbjQ (UPF0145 family)